MLIPIY